MSFISLFEQKTPKEIRELLTNDFNDFRNVYYNRHLKTHYGLIEVKVQEDRLNLFKT